MDKYAVSQRRTVSEGIQLSDSINQCLTFSTPEKGTEKSLIRRHPAFEDWIMALHILYSFGILKKVCRISEEVVKEIWEAWLFKRLSPRNLRNYFLNMNVGIYLYIVIRDVVAVDTGLVVLNLA